jgi:4-hydroxybenzoate polyprenyltransferase/phosphoserine phosphatase
VAVLTRDREGTRGAASAATAASDVPLVVDLDGTLLRGNSLVESLFAVARQRPQALLALPQRLLQGRARLKEALAEPQAVDVATLPFDPDLLRHLRSEKARGRRLVLATGADQRLARAVAVELGLFDEVLASDGRTNLTAGCKRERLVERFGERGFDYAGNSADDLPVWAAARRALVVAPSRRVAQAASDVTRVERVFLRPMPSLGVVLGAMRLHHWVKNALLLVALVAAQRMNDTAALGAVLAGALAFGLAASGIYLLNDLLDLRSDRRHPAKCRRALASGALPLSAALALLPLLWLGAAAIGVMLGASFVGALGLYVATMVVYSLGLKDVAVVDALVLAGGYALRVEAGGLAAGLAVSPWLTICAAALFFGLALLKRYAELVTLRPGLARDARMRGYRVADAPLIAGAGLAAGLVAVALLATYPVVEPATPHWTAWLVSALLLVWTGHMWLMAHRGRIRDDPVTYALHERPSQVLGALTAAVLLFAR